MEKCQHLLSDLLAWWSILLRTMAEFRCLENLLTMPKVYQTLEIRSLLTALALLTNSVNDGFQIVTACSDSILARSVRW